MDSLSLMSAGLMLAVPVGAAVAWYNHRRWLAERHEEGLSWCGTLLDLIMRVQQHRGMSAALLAGDKSFRESQLTKRREIDHLLAYLGTLPGDLDRTLSSISARELPALSERWQALCRDLDSLSPFESMTRHTALIGTLLTWLRSIGEACLSGDKRSGELQLGTLIPVFVDRLPALSETLGQIRALGASVAAAGELSAPNRVKLCYLVHRINELGGRTELALQHAGLLGDAETRRGYELARDNVKALLDMVRDEILDRPHIDVPSKAYFATATQAIDAVFGLVGVLRREFEGRNEVERAHWHAPVQRSAS